MRRINSPLYVMAGLALAGVGIGSLVSAADGVTIADRMGDVTAMFITDASQAPVQTITAGCGATCDLYASSASINVPGLSANVPVWGFSTAVDSPPTLPGPTIVVNAGDTVTVTLHNGLGTDLALDFPSVATADRTGTFGTAAANGVATYTFVANQVGTSTYGAGASSPIGNRQRAMGLSGVLIVRPAECALGDPQVFAGCAYGDPDSLTGLNAGSIGYDVGTDAFQDEALVAMNDIDLDFAAAPLTYDMTKYHPTAHLINGKVYPETDVIDTQTGHHVLLRYANLGTVDHSMALVGSHQRIIGRDASAIPHGSTDVTVPLNVGQTVDAMVKVPLDALGGFRYSLADQAREPGSLSANGAMTFLTVFGAQPAEGLPFGDIWDITELGGAPNSGSETAGYTELTFAGSITGTPTFAEFSIDEPGAPLNSSTNDPKTPGEVVIDNGSFHGSIPTTELATLVNGNHTLWVRFGVPSAGDPLVPVWGNPAGISFTIDRAGPVVTPVDVDPIYTNGSVDVAIRATADATLTGTGEVLDGTASIDACPEIATQPTGLDLTPNGAGANGEGPIVELSGTIPALQVNGLADGEHTINVAAVDTRGRWSNDGAPGAVQAPKCGAGRLVVDRVAPATTGGAVAPNPNDGTQAFPGIQSFLDVVRITATVTDPAPAAGVSQVEGFIDDGLLPLPLTSADYGTGFLFTAVDGLFDSEVEQVYADIPLASIASMTPGDHSIWVHGQDLAGNWESLVDGTGAMLPATTTLTVLNGAPRVSTMTVDAAGDVAVTAGAFGVGVTITAFEYTIGAAPAAPGSGTAAAPITPAAVVSTVIGPLVIPANGNVWVRAQDSTGKWGPAVGLPTAGTPAITNQRRRLTGTAVATIGTVSAVEWSVGPTAAAAGTGTPVQQLSLSGNYRTDRPNNNRFVTGTTVWVRAQDSQGNWGPATSVLVP